MRIFLILALATLSPSAFADGLTLQAAQKNFLDTKIILKATVSDFLIQVQGCKPPGMSAFQDGFGAALGGLDVHEQNVNGHIKKAEDALSAVSAAPINGVDICQGGATAFHNSVAAVEAIVNQLVIDLEQDRQKYNEKMQGGLSQEKKIKMALDLGGLKPAQLTGDTNRANACRNALATVDSSKPGSLQALNQEIDGRLVAIEGVYQSRLAALKAQEAQLLASAHCGSPEESGDDSSPDHASAL
ncbi:MAG TPA: hypothetical protein VIH99_07500 [Bdellovibrionota bacterium]|jgi:hypothetical protein